MDRKLDSFENYLIKLQKKGKTDEQNKRRKRQDINHRKNNNAPLKLVWEAWTKPEHIALWWGPKGMEVKVVDHNFKVGADGNIQ